MSRTDLNHHIGNRLALPDISGDQLGDDVHLHSLVGRSFQQSFRDNQDDTHSEANNDKAPDRELRIPVTNGEDTCSQDYRRQSEVPPIWDFSVFVHKSLVDIFTSVTRVLEL
jgi:hypothetical protein